MRSPPLQVMFRHVTVIANQLNTAQPINISLQQTNIYRNGSMSNVDTTGSEGGGGLANLIVFVYFLHIISYIILRL